MHKILSIVLVTLSLIVSLSCKGQRFIQVIDEEREALSHAYAEIHWNNGDVETLTCDEKGKIELTKPGRVVVRVRCYGYSAVDDTLEASVTSKIYQLNILPFYKKRVTVTGGGKDEKDIESVHKVKVIRAGYLKAARS